MKKITPFEINEILKMQIFEDEPPLLIEENFRKLNKIFQILYDFILIYNSYSIKPRNYSHSKEILSMIEAHILLKIVDNPKITVSDLANFFKKTPSAISQIVKKLIQKEYIYREISPINAKFFYLIPTEKAKIFTLCHKHYDNIDSVKTLKKLAKYCSTEEIVCFYKVMETFTFILESKKEK